MEWCIWNPMGYLGYVVYFFVCLFICLVFLTQPLYLLGSEIRFHVWRDWLKTKVYLSLGDPALARFGDGGQFLSEEESGPQRRDLRAVIPWPLQSRDQDGLLDLDLDLDERARLSRSPL